MNSKIEVINLSEEQKKQNAATARKNTMIH